MNGQTVLKPSRLEMRVAEQLIATSPEKTSPVDFAGNHAADRFTQRVRWLRSEAGDQPLIDLGVSNVRRTLTRLQVSA